MVPVRWHNQYEKSKIHVGPKTRTTHTGCPPLTRRGEPEWLGDLWNGGMSKSKRDQWGVGGQKEEGREGWNP